RLRSVSCFLCFFLGIPLPPRSTLFPYTTLFRSAGGVFHGQHGGLRADVLDLLLTRERRHLPPPCRTSAPGGTCRFACRAAIPSRYRRRGRPAAARPPRHQCCAGRTPRPPSGTPAPARRAAPLRSGRRRVAPRSRPGWARCRRGPCPPDRGTSPGTRSLTQPSLPSFQLELPKVHQPR